MKKTLFLIVVIFMFVGTVFAKPIDDSDRGASSTPTPTNQSLYQSAGSQKNQGNNKKLEATSESVFVDAQGNVIPTFPPLTPYSYENSGRMCIGGVCPSTKPPLSFPPTYTATPQ